LCYLQIFDWFLKQGRRFMAKDILLFLLHHSRLASKLIQNIPTNLSASAKSKLMFFVEIE
jgi:hypothetical protein